MTISKFYVNGDYYYYFLWSSCGGKISKIISKDSAKIIFS